MGTVKTADKPIRCAVITGGHGYDVLNFHRFFRGLAGVDAYIQHMDDFASARASVRDGYDVVLFYTMLMDGPHRRRGTVVRGETQDCIGTSGRDGARHRLPAPRHPRLPAVAGVERDGGHPDRSFGHHPDQTLRVEIASPETSDNHRQ